MHDDKAFLLERKSCVKLFGELKNLHARTKHLITFYSSKDKNEKDSNEILAVLCEYYSLTWYYKTLLEKKIDPENLIYNEKTGTKDVFLSAMEAQSIKTFDTAMKICENVMNTYNISLELQ